MEPASCIPGPQEGTEPGAGHRGQRVQPPHNSEQLRWGPAKWVRNCHVVAFCKTGGRWQRACDSSSRTAYRAMSQGASQAVLSRLGPDSGCVSLLTRAVTRVPCWLRSQSPSSTHLLSPCLTHYEIALVLPLCIPIVPSPRATPGAIGSPAPPPALHPILFQAVRGVFKEADVLTVSSSWETALASHHPGSWAAGPSFHHLWAGCLLLNNPASTQGPSPQRRLSRPMRSIHWSLAPLGPVIWHIS